MRRVTRWDSWVVAVGVGISLFNLCSSVGLAVPASSAVGTVRQPDGTAVEGRLFGDEWYHWNETLDGYVILQGADGWWRYAVRDAGGDLVAGPQRVGVDARPAALQPKLRPDQAIVTQRIRAVRQAAGHLEARPLAAVGPVPVEEVEKPPVEVEPRGTVKNLVILCRFSDHTTTGVRPASEYDPLFNQVGYVADGAVGSVKDYYSEVSYGTLTLNSTIAAAAWVNLPQTEAYYGADSGPTKDVNIRQMIVDAITAANNAGADFSQYDTDGDGWIDAIDIIHSGYGQEYLGAPTTYVWSKRGFLGDSLAVQMDGVWISGYHTEPALRNLSGTNIVRIGVICHETGHFFGLPDLYDTDGAGSGGSCEGIGSWGLMGSGSWGADGTSWPQRPTHMCGWSKMQMGWLDPTPIHTNTAWSLLRVEDNAAAYIVREGLPNAESFMVSNRQATGFDANLLNGGGLEILHADEASLNNNAPYDLKVTFEEADGDWSLMASGTRAETGDPWPGSLSRTTFSTATIPNTNSNPSTGGSPSSISFSSISANGNPMTFNLRTLVPWIDVPATDPDGNYNATWTSSAGATQYELQEATTTTVTAYSDNCDDEARFRGDWTALGLVRRVVPPSEGDSVYVAQFYDPGTSTWYDSFYSLKLRKRFRVTTSTTISYSIKYGFYSSGKDANVGYFQIRRVTDAAWTTLSRFTDYGLAGWNAWTETSGELAPFVGSECEVRFIAINNVGTVWTWANWPYDGFAIDDFSINSAQMVDYSWTTLSTSATSPYAISKGSGGAWFYRVRAYSGGQWRDWSNVDGVRVALSPTITAASVQDLGTATGSDTALATAQAGYANERSVRVAVTTTSGAPDQIRVAESQAALTVAGYVAFTPPNYDGYFLSDSDGGKDIWVQVRSAGGESNQYNIGGLGTDIVLDRVTPASTGITTPTVGSVLPGGSPSAINWNTFTDVNGVKANSVSLAYDTTGGAGGYPNSIVTGEANDGTYSWNPVPSIDSLTVRVRARAYDVAGNLGSVANTGSFSIDSTPPTAPGTPTDAGLYTSSTSVRFDWTAGADVGASASGVGSYDLQVGTAPGGNNVFDRNVGNVLTNTITGADGQRVYARVRTRDRAGNPSPWSGNSDGILVDLDSPTTPGIPTHVGPHTSSTSVRFNWAAASDPGTNPSGLKSYDLQVGTTPRGSNVFNANVGNVTSKTVTGSNGQTLYARVRARDLAENIGGWSDSSSSITIDTVRPRLTGLTVRDQASLQITFDEPVRYADQPSNYTCTRGLRVIEVVRLTDIQYNLFTTDQQTDTSYTLTATSGIKDRAGNSLDPSYRSRAFQGGKRAGVRVWQPYR